MNLKEYFLTENDCYKEGIEMYKKGIRMKPIGIMVHSTGANNPDLKRYVNPDDGLLGNNLNKNHWNNPNIKLCVHAFIGKLINGNIATYQTLPWDMRGWHAGKGAKGSANDGYISFEICEDTLTDKTYFDKVYKEAVELTAMLCKKYGINPEKPSVICHSEGRTLGIASNHADVMHWFPSFSKSMDTFRADVANEIGYVIVNYPSLKKGNKGDSVKTLQIRLNGFGNNLVVDGDFGVGTENALKDFQKKNGLTADGICGALTWAALNKPVKTPEEISVQNAVKDGVITDADYWLNALYGKTAVSKENLKALIDRYHAVTINS